MTRLPGGSRPTNKEKIKHYTVNKTNMAEDNNKNNNRSLTILQWNCRGLGGVPQGELIDAIENEQIDPDIICLQEMFKTSKLKGYKLVNFQFNKIQRAGVGTFIKTKYSPY